MSPTPAALRDRLVTTPRLLLAVDGLGAVTSALLLGLVVARWDDVFGMPPEVVRPLAAVAGGFAVYSLTCAALGATAPRWLRGIATLNTAYVLVTLALCAVHLDRLTALGLAYFVGEAAIVLPLAWVERAAALRPGVAAARG